MDKRDMKEQAVGVAEGLVERLPAEATWADLALPQSQQEALRSITFDAQRRTSATEAGARNAGSSASPASLTALFVGPDSTGQTRAAEVLARELGRDLYRVDLGRLTSKYIGETEKNLNRVLEAAQSRGWVLFFDEADALFGKRTDVKDSHDRYANLDTSYLLERLEAFQGLAILATNRKASRDDAFIRRIRHVVDFPQR